MAEVITWQPADEVALLPASSLADYWALLKPRVMLLVVFCGAIGLWVAPGHLHPFQSFMAVLCIAAATGASAAFNMWYERDLDAKMQRTQNRPLPAGRIEPHNAVSFAAVLGLFSVMMMGISTNWHAAFWLFMAIAAYCGLYTLLLKRRTPQNIVIGGIAGALPPLIGWVAVTGQMALLPWLMVAVIFLWTPPHFWALALYRHEDYRNAGVPMLPVVAGERATIRAILRYTLLLVTASLLAVPFTPLGMLYAAAAAVLGASFLFLAAMLARRPGKANAMRLFAYSILYLFLLFAAMALDQRLAG